MRSETELKSAIDTYADMVRKVCFVHCKNEADVDDVFQEVFLKYYHHQKDFKDAEHEKAWILRVTINACHDLFRGWFKQKVDLSEDMNQFSIDRESSGGQLLEYVRELNPKLRNVLYLHYYEGYTMKEISEIINVNENTVSTWIRRGKAKLKEMIGGDFFE